MSCCCLGTQPATVQQRIDEAGWISQLEGASTVGKTTLLSKAGSEGKSWTWWSLELVLRLQCPSGWISLVEKGLPRGCLLRLHVHTASACVAQHVLHVPSVLETTGACARGPGRFGVLGRPLRQKCELAPGVCAWWPS